MPIKRRSSLQEASRLGLLVAGMGLLSGACSTPEPLPDVAPLVAAHLAEENSLGVRPEELKVMANPRGEGHFVYVERTLFDEGRRFLVWLVLDDVAYTINGQTHNLTPDLPFPAAAGEERWARTGLDPRRATGTLEIVFGTD